MNVSEVKKFCLGFPGARQEENAEPSNVMVFYIRDKKFAYFKTSSPEKWRFSVRVTPGRFLELTDQPGIKPARYMHRFHWVSIVDVSLFDQHYLKELVRWSYEKAASSLPKKVLAEIQG